MNKKIAVYDNTVSSRTYLSYIAEQAGGFAHIGRDGKLYIRKIGQDIAEVPLKYFQSFKWGERFKASLVRYEDGVQLFEKGDRTENTVYINQDNMYIIDQEQIEGIYEQIKDLEVYSFEGESIIDPALDIGDLILVDGKYAIYQGAIEYKGKFKANISSKIQCKEKETTTVRTPSQKTINRRVQSKIDQEEAKITQLAEEASEHEEKLSLHEQDLDSIKQKIANTLDYKREAEGITEVYLENAGNADILKFEVKGDKTYLSDLYPKEKLHTRSNLYPNQRGG